MQGAWNEFESATAWFNVLPQKNESTNRVKSTVVALSLVQSDNLCLHGGGGGGGGGHLQEDNSRTKCAGVFTPQVFSPVVQSSSPVR